MADITKYAPINGATTLFSDFKIQYFSLFRTKRTVTLAYGFVFIFFAFTIFLAFTPAQNSSSQWFTSMFSSTSSGVSEESYRSQFSSIVNYFFTNSSSSSSQSHNASPTEKEKDRSQNTTLLTSNLDKVEALEHKNGTVLPAVNQTVKNDPNPPKLSKGSPNFEDQSQKSNQLPDKVEVLKQNSSTNIAKNVTLESGEGIVEKGLFKNLTSSLGKVQDNVSSVAHGKQGIDVVIDSLVNCDYFDGNWVKDDSYPLYNPGSCTLIDEQFNCFRNGRPDNGYHKMKWKPKGCTLPRLNGSHMLELLRGRRLVFVGDSLNRNMWESLICILKNSVKDQKKVYEESGRHHFRTEASYSFVFQDYKCTVEFFVSPFLVQEWEVSNKNGTKLETLRLDLIGSLADKYKTADVIVFNTGHWWTHEKTSKGQDYYQEGSHVYKELDVTEAFRKALTTWGRWVDTNINPTKSLVFFRGYSASHFSGGQWNSGGQCDHETEPIKNETYLTPYPQKMTVLERVLKGMKSQVTYLNVTRMTDYRKDGHPSVYRKIHLSDEEKKSPLSFQDCSHWCLPGVPDAWNEILYAELLVKLKKKKRSRVHK